MLIIRKKHSNSRKSGVPLMRYILRPNEGNPQGVLNAVNQEKERFLSEVESTIFGLVSLKIPVSHFILSFLKKEEKKAIQNAREIVEIFLKEMRLENVLAAYGVHTDADTAHIHVGVVMGDLVTGKSRNENSLAKLAMDTCGVLCQKYGFESPLWDYRILLKGVEDSFKSKDWETIHENLAAMNVEVSTSQDRSGYDLKSGRWSVELGTMFGFARERRYFEMMGPCPVAPKKTLPKKPNFWVVKKAAQSSLYKEKKMMTDGFDQQIAKAEREARNYVDEYKVMALYEADMLEMARLAARNVLFFYKSVVKSITQEAWNLRWEVIEEGLWRWIHEKERTEVVLSLLDVTPRKIEPEHALVQNM